jgi:hypothetical protein
MTEDPVATLAELAEELETEFEEYRPLNDFRDVTVMVDNSDSEHPTLIVQIDHQNADEIATQVESFLNDRGVRTEVEHYEEAMIRVLGAV